MDSVRRDYSKQQVRSSSSNMDRDLGTIATPLVGHPPLRNQSLADFISYVENSTEPVARERSRERDSVRMPQQAIGCHISPHDPVHNEQLSNDDLERLNALYNAPNFGLMTENFNTWLDRNFPSPSEAAQPQPQVEINDDLQLAEPNIQSNQDKTQMQTLHKNALLACGIPIDHQGKLPYNKIQQIFDYYKKQNIKFKDLIIDPEKPSQKTLLQNLYRKIKDREPVPDPRDSSKTISYAARKLRAYRKSQTG